MISHALEDGQRIGPRSGAGLSLLFLDEADHRALEEMHGQILEGTSSGKGSSATVRRRGGPRRLTLTQPGA
jgi:hypothetical protein